MYALTQLDAALAVGQRELAAYAENDPDSAYPLVEERESMVLSALSAMEANSAGDQRLLISKLELVLDQQRQLVTAARRLRDEIAQSLNASKPQVQRLAGYKRAAKPTIVTRSFAKS